MTDQEKIDILRAALGVLVDCVDYNNGACALTEQVGAVLPPNVLLQANEALRQTK